MPNPNRRTYFVGPGTADSFDLTRSGLPVLHAYFSSLLIRLRFSFSPFFRFYIIAVSSALQAQEPIETVDCLGILDAKVDVHLTVEGPETCHLLLRCLHVIEEHMGAGGL